MGYTLNAITNYMTVPIAPLNSIIFAHAETSYGMMIFTNKAKNLFRLPVVARKNLTFWQSILYAYPFVQCNTLTKLLAITSCRSSSISSHAILPGSGIMLFMIIMWASSVILLVALHIPEMITSCVLFICISPFVV